MDPKNILLIRLSSIGDVLHCTPVAKTLRERFPKAQISWLVGEASQSILHGNPYLDEIIVWQREKWEREFRKGDWRGGYSDFRLLEQSLREKKYDVTIDMHGLLLTSVIAWRSEAQTRIGFANAKEGSPLLYTHKVQVKAVLPITEHYLQLLSPLGVKKFSTEMVMPIAREHREFAERIFREYQINKDDTVVVLNPSTSWATKCWPAEYFAKLANHLAQLKVRIIILGAASDMPLVEKIVQNTSVDIINLAGRTNLKELAAIMEKINLFIGGDTGPLHIAAAVGAPTVSLFGPTNPRIYTPQGPEHIVLDAGVSCRYCHRKTCKNWICMREISPEVVFAAAQQAIDKYAIKKKNMEATIYERVPIKKIYSSV